MDLLDALADDVTLKQFFMDWAPKLFDARREDFAAASDIDLILCFKFEDTDEVYTVEMSEGGLVVEDDEMIDFPALTMIGLASNWPRTREALRPLAQALDSRRAEIRETYRLSKAFHADWEKFDVVIDIEVFDEDQSDSVAFSIVLNDYDAPSSARRFGFRVPLSALDAMAGGERTPDEVAKTLKISGDMRVAATLGGMIISHQSR